ncbi:MAG: hypothetical protein E7557_02195 [Ruminococcaceae bacterium]|nr:hypothetical protein [Oscillospiraceae bacterium]
MSKKAIVILIAAILSFTAIFTACNKDNYTDPSSGDKYILVTDENGEKVLSPDGELLVYVTDENGKKVKDEEGNFVTEVHGFIGQIENDGVVEDYAYYFTLPSGWKTVNDRGEFENKTKNYALKIAIKEQTFEKYYEFSKGVYDLLVSEQQDKSKEDLEVIWKELEYETADSKVVLLVAEQGEGSQATLFFVNSKNLYEIILTANGDCSSADMESEILTIYDSLEFKPYTYYGETTAE